MPRMTRVRVQEIATQAGVAVPTAYEALRGAGRMTDATRQRILAVAKELGWQRDWRGATLARRRSQVIGLLSGTRHPLLGGIYAELVAHLVEFLAERDHNLLILPAADERWRQQLTDGRVDGAIVVQPLPKGLADFQAQHPVPLVLLNLPADLPVDQVLIDEQTLMLRLVDKLLTTGATRLAYVRVKFPDKDGLRGHPSETLRREAYAWTFICETWPWELEQALPVADAYCCYNEGDAALVQGLLRQRGCQAPIGCLAGSNLTYFIKPSPLTIDLPVAAMAKRAVELLLQRIAGESGPPRCEYLT